MSIVFNDNIENRTPKALDDQTGVFEGGIWRPWNSILEAVESDKLNIAYRNIGLTICITVDGVTTEYWWRDGINNDQLVRKESNSGQYFNITDANFELDKRTYYNPDLVTMDYTVEYAGNQLGGGSWDKGLMLEGSEYERLSTGGFVLLLPYEANVGDVFQIANVSNSLVDNSDKQSTSQKNQPNGYAGLDANGKVLESLITGNKAYIDNKDAVLQTQINDMIATIVESWTEVIYFTYDGTNNVISLTFTPKKIGVSFFVSQTILNPFYDYYYENNTMVLRPSSLTIGVEYHLITQYFK